MQHYQNLFKSKSLEEIRKDYSNNETITSAKTQILRPINLWADVVSKTVASTLGKYDGESQWVLPITMVVAAIVFMTLPFLILGMVVGLVPTLSIIALLSMVLLIDTFISNNV